MKKLIYTALLITSALSMNACHVYLAPTTYRCMDIDALYEFREKPIGEPGMTSEQFRQAYEQSKLSLSYDNSEESLVYLKHNSCSIWRYRFDKGRLVARGYLVQEMGFWSYSETNFEETSVTENAILDAQYNLIGVRIRTKKPIYNSQGELTAIKETWIDKIN